MLINLLTYRDAIAIINASLKAGTLPDTDEVDRIARIFLKRDRDAPISNDDADLLDTII